MSFLNPGAWWFAALFAVLVALYLWERTRRRFDVPSLLLWESVPETTVRATQFRPDWLFVLQCLLLALLIAGLAGPLLRPDAVGTAARRTVFVLDLSASMQAREARTSRFEMARAALHARVDALSGDDEAMLIAAAHHPQVAAPFTRDHAQLLGSLAALEPIDARADLDAAMAIAVRAADSRAPAAAIELFTDARRERLAEAWRDRVGLFPVGETDDNLAIESLQVFQGRFQDPRDAHAYVAVRNFAHREAHGFLTLQLDDVVFSRQGFSLAPRSIGGFPLSALPGAGVLRASLEVDDALAPDNVAFAYVQPARPLHLRLVSDDAALPALLQRIARAAPTLTLDVVAPAAYAGAGGADVVLFHRFAPPPPSDAAALYVAPTAAARGPFVVHGPVGALRVVDWDPQHPVLRDLRPELPFALDAVQSVELPTWADPFLTGRADGHDLALAFAGEHDGQRRAVLAFDLANADLLHADHIDLLLMFLNLLDWLAPADAAVHVVRTGDVEVVDALPVRPRHVTDPRHRDSTLPADDTVVIDAAYAGEYRIAADGTRVRVFANLADAEESDIGRAPGAYVAPRVAPAGTATTPAERSSGIGRWLYAVAAFLLVMEWLAARRSA